MIKASDVADPERALSLAYAPAGTRSALAALWRLDEQLGACVARTDAPVVGQMKLTWWHDALVGLHRSRPVDPVLVALTATPEIDATALLPLIDGWEMLLDQLPLPEEALRDYAEQRGGTLFAAAAKLLSAESRAAVEAGRLWALVDLAFRISDRTTAERALTLAAAAPPKHLPRPLRLLASLAAMDAGRGLDRPRSQGSPLRIGRAAWAAVTGL